GTLPTLGDAPAPAPSCKSGGSETDPPGLALPDWGAGSWGGDQRRERRGVALP
ncbi:hypothetical protein P7K49_025985, partial [Saguinus oedipus]